MGTKKCLKFQHDPETVSECVPGGENGNYKMSCFSMILRPYLSVSLAERMGTI